MEPASERVRKGTFLREGATVATQAWLVLRTSSKAKVTVEFREQEVPRVRRKGKKHKERRFPSRRYTFLGLLAYASPPHILSIVTCTWSF